MLYYMGNMGNDMRSTLWAQFDKVVRYMRLTDKKKNLIKERCFVWGLLVIPLLYFFVFYFGMIVKTITMAFQLKNIDSITGEVTTYWTFDNFKNVWADLTKGDQGDLLMATRNTLLFFLLGQITFPIGFITSYFLWKKVPLAGVYRLLFFIPGMLSGVVWTNIYRELIGANGPIAQLHQAITGATEPYTYLTDNRYALIAVMGYSIWFCISSNFILYSGNLSRIPKELEEAGQLEGITPWQELIHVVVPLMWPMISTFWILSLVGLLGASGNILMLTGGAYNTNTLSHYLFTRVYNVPDTSNLHNFSSALGLVMTAITLPIVFFTRHMVEKIPPVEF